MRYEVDCELFCTEGKLDADLLTDPVILAGQRKAEIVGNIERLRSERWGFCTVTIEKNNPVIKVTNKIALENSIENEQKEMQELASLINIFNKLNSLFCEIQKKYPRIYSPSLIGVKQLRTDSIDTINNLTRRIKSEVQFRTGIQSKGKTLDDVLKDPGFLHMKEENEKYIKIEEAKIKEFDHYIATIKNILKVGE